MLIKRLTAVSVLFLSACDEAPLPPDPIPPSNCEDACIVADGADLTCDVECDARDKCNEVVDKVCGTLTSLSCEVGFNDCKNDLLLVYSCTDATGIGDSYETCLNDIARISRCGEDLPSACLNLVAVNQRRFPEPCLDDLEFAFCPDNSTPTCAEQLGQPSCPCNTGFVRVASQDETQSCVPTCQQLIDSDGPGRCETLFGPGFVASCDGQDLTENYLCVCDDGFRLIDGVPGPDEGELACIPQVCTQLAPFVVCRDPLGQPEPNCACDCRDAVSASDNPSCFCNPGFRSSEGRCIPE